MIAREHSETDREPASTPRVSVVIPTYNRCGYVQEAIDSVLAQTYTAYEIIVVDDGSTDGTGDVLRERYGDRIVYYWQQNAGRSAARNRGLDVAFGELIAFLDDDDLYLPGKLATQAAFMDVHPEVDVVASGVQIIDAKGTPADVWRPWEQQPELTLSKCVSSCPLTTCGVMLRREALSKLDYGFDPTIEPAEDTDFFLRLMLAGCRVDWVKEIVAAYRQHSANSQGDAAGYSRACARLWPKFFALPGVPPEVVVLRPQVEASEHLKSSAMYYAAGDDASAQARLRQAAALVPAWVASGELLERVLRYPESPIVRLDPNTYRHRVLSNLPPGLDRPAIRKGALARVAMAKVFGAAARADWAMVRAHWWQGVRQDPTWLKNRGVLAIGVRGFLGWRLWSMARRLLRGVQ